MHNKVRQGFLLSNVMTLTPNLTASAVNWGVDETNSYVLVQNDQGRTLYAKAVFLVAGPTSSAIVPNSPSNWGVAETNSYVTVGGASKTLFAKTTFIIPS